MKKEVEIDENIYDKYTVEGKATCIDSLKTDKIYTTIDNEGLIKQCKTLYLNDMYNLIGLEDGDRVKITLEKI